MEIGSHTWEHPNMTTIPVAAIAGQLARGKEAIAAATGLGQQNARTVTSAMPAARPRPACRTWPSSAPTWRTST